MAIIRSFKNLEAWQKSMALLPDAYSLAAKLPSYERYGLADQIRRSVTSIPSNLAKGSKRGSRADFRQFCVVAAGSSAELETQLLIAYQLYRLEGINDIIERLLPIQIMLTKLNQARSPLVPRQTINHKP